MNRRHALIWKWTAWSVAAVAVPTAIAVWLGQEDTREIAPGERDVSGLTDELARTLPADVPSLQFVDIAASLPLGPQFQGARTHQLPEDMGGGVAMADLDGDGDLDLLFVGTGPLPDGGASQLLRNDTPAGGPPAFTDVTEGSGLGDRRMGMGVATADIDGDRDLDLVLTHDNGLRLLRNDGELRFTDITDDAGVANAEGWCSSAAFGDADGDGDLDLYVCRYVAYRAVAGGTVASQYGRKIPFGLNPSSFSPLPNLLYLNDGAGTFVGGVDAAVRFGVDCPRGRSLGAVWADFDLDRVPELYIANDVSDNVLYHGYDDGEGGRRFEDESYATATADYRGAMGLAVADADGDGDDEMFVSHWVAQENAFYRNLFHDEKGAGGRVLFVDDADRVGLGAIALDFVGWSSSFADLDLDGRLEIVVANGSTLELEERPAELINERPLFFWNAGERGFFDVAEAWGEALAVPRGLRGGAVGDLDRDGDLDIVFGSLEGLPRVLVNDGPPRGRSLTVRLSGPAGNTFGIAARVLIDVGGRQFSREMRSSPGYASAGPPELLFGLGAATGPARVRVLWPDGQTTETTVSDGTLDVEVAL